MINFLYIVLVTLGFGLKNKIVDSDYIEQHNDETGFGDFYDKNIKPQIEDFEIIRAKHIKTIAFRGRLICLFWIIWPTLNSIMDKYFISSASVMLFALTFVFSVFSLWFSLYIIYRPISNFKQDFDKKLFEKSCEFFGESTFRKKRRYESIEQDYTKFEIQAFSEALSDLFSQNYLSISGKNLRISVEKIRIRIPLGFGPGTIKANLFNGTAIITQINQNFETPIFIIENHFSLFNRRQHFKNGCKRKGQKLHEIKTNDQEFDKTFTIYSQGTTDVRKLLTPQFIAKFKKLPQAFKSKRVRASFVGNEMLLTIDKVNLLNIRNLSLFKRIDLAHEYRQTLNHLNMIIKAVKVDLT